LPTKAAKRRTPIDADLIQPAFAQEGSGGQPSPLRGIEQVQTSVHDGWLANRSREAAKVGGARRDRTADLLIANEALSQLSYGPAES
jgi:hypothetical protein